MINEKTETQPTKDSEHAARGSFFVAVCDCDDAAFVSGYGCIHPFHVAPNSALSTPVEIEGAHS